MKQRLTGKRRLWIEVFKFGGGPGKGRLQVVLRGSCHQPKKLRSTPAATADPITPATLGPMACMSR